MYNPRSVSVVRAWLNRVILSGETFESFQHQGFGGCPQRSIKDLTTNLGCRNCPADVLHEGGTCIFVQSTATILESGASNAQIALAAIETLALLELNQGDGDEATQTVQA